MSEKPGIAEVVGHQYCPAREVPERFPDLFTLRRWEWLMRQRQVNGLDRAVRKLGGRLYINLSVLFEIIEESNDTV